MRFTIVTPCLNGARFIDETILSVVGQAGPFAVRYHVQDGGSTDGTLDKLARWQSLLSGPFPILCDGIDFSYSSAPDGGMYSAINGGFDQCGEGDVMAWINADDRFEPGAFHLVADLLSHFKDVDWLCGRIATLDENGALMVSAPMPYPRNAIIAGLMDGRHWEFVQQEGTFWRRRLWLEAGSLDPAFRLAGDFDLWRRFAKYSDLVTVDSILGCYRRRQGQATSDLTNYNAEVDRSMAPAEKLQGAILAHAYLRAVSPRAKRSMGFTYRIIYRQNAEKWVCEELPAVHPTRPLTLRSIPYAVWSGGGRLVKRLSFRKRLRSLAK